MKPSIVILISLLLVTAVFSAMVLSAGCGTDRGNRTNDPDAREKALQELRRLGVK
jgi:hypothetical protein